MKTITVVTLVTERKAYCLADLLAAFRALKRPAGYTVRFLVVVAGDLTEAHEAQLVAFDAEQPDRRVRTVEVERGPDIVRYAGDTYQCSLTAGELRERARKVLARRKDAAVLWVDCDVLPPADTLPRLLAHGRALASGLVLNRLQGTPIAGAKRWDPLTPMPAESAWKLAQGAQEVVWTGFGLLLVRGDLAREISFQPYLEGAVPVWTGEDGYFCAAATERCGELVLLDATLSPWHVDGTGLAVRAEWTPDGELVRALRLIGEAAPVQACLIPRISGESRTLGTLLAGVPHYTDVDGRPLTLDEMRLIAAGSPRIDLVEPGA